MLGDSPDKETTRKELYLAVDKLIARTFDLQPSLDNGEFEELTITLSVEHHDEDGRPFTSYTLEHKSAKTR